MVSRLRVCIHLVSRCCATIDRQREAVVTVIQYNMPQKGQLRHHQDRRSIRFRPGRTMARKIQPVYEVMGLPGAVFHDVIADEDIYR